MTNRTPLSKSIACGLRVNRTWLSELNWLTEWSVWQAEHRLMLGVSVMLSWTCLLEYTRFLPGINMLLKVISHSTTACLFVSACLSLSQLVSACLSEVAVLSPAEAFLLTALPSAAAVQPWARTRVQKLNCVLPVGNWLC